MRLLLIGRNHAAKASPNIYPQKAIAKAIGYIVGKITFAIILDCAISDDSPAIP